MNSSPPIPAPAPLQAPPVTHYENFPVASLLCPPGLRAPIAAIYAFARTADDLADEGDRTAEERLQQLQAYRDALAACAQAPDPLQAAAATAWPEVFGPLAHALQTHALPVPLLDDLLTAFIQDVTYTASGRRYADRAELLDYCRYSANPVGRLLLHLYGVQDENALRQSDAICSALQLINFWQDVSVDMARARFYLPDADCLRQDLPVQTDWPEDLLYTHEVPVQVLMRELCRWARALMLEGAPLVHRVPGRAGWELRLVVQGGLRVLDLVQDLHAEVVTTRPKLRATDWPRILWRAWRMQPPRPAA